MAAGTKAADIASILARIPLEKRNTVVEVTLDMAESMEAIVRRSFPNARLVTDRFHGQQGERHAQEGRQPHDVDRLVGIDEAGRDQAAEQEKENRQDERQQRWADAP